MLSSALLDENGLKFKEEYRAKDNHLKDAGILKY